MEALHEKNIHYRDLKPENILISSNGYIKLCDFGLSKELTSRDKTYSFCGTVEYMAPEIILGEGYDRKTDFWSLGVFIFEMLIGITPFYSNDPLVLYEMICYCKLMFPENLPLTENCEKLIRKLLEKNQDERLGYSGVNELKSHSFFESIDFKEILSQTASSPELSIPDKLFDVSQFENEYTSEEIRYTIIDESEVNYIRKFNQLFDDF